MKGCKTKAQGKVSIEQLKTGVDRSSKQDEETYFLIFFFSYSRLSHILLCIILIILTSFANQETNQCSFCFS